MSGTGRLRLSKPCENCPFRTEGAIQLRPGRLEEIADTLMDDDYAAFYCHKTLERSGEVDEDGQYQESGSEAFCAGAAAYLLNQGRPNVSMRVAMATGEVEQNYWDRARDMVIEAL